MKDLIHANKFPLNAIHIFHCHSFIFFPLSLQLLLLCELWWDIHQFFHIAIKCTKTVFALCIICRVFSKIPAFDSVCLRWMDGWIKVKPSPPPHSKYRRYKYNNPPQSSSFMIYVRTAMTIAIPGLNSNHFTKKESTPKWQFASWTKSDMSQSCEIVAVQLNTKENLIVVPYRFNKTKSSSGLPTNK